MYHGGKPYVRTLGTLTQKHSRNWNGTFLTFFHLVMENIGSKFSAALIEEKIGIFKYFETHERQSCYSVHVCVCIICFGLVLIKCSVSEPIRAIIFNWFLIKIVQNRYGATTEYQMNFLLNQFFPQAELHRTKIHFYNMESI